MLTIEEARLEPGTEIYTETDHEMIQVFEILNNENYEFCVLEDDRTVQILGDYKNVKKEKKSFDLVNCRNHVRSFLASLEVHRNRV